MSVIMVTSNLKKIEFSKAVCDWRHDQGKAIKETQKPVRAE